MSNKNFLTEYENSSSLLMYQPKVELTEEKGDESGFLQSII